MFNEKTQTGWGALAAIWVVSSPFMLWLFGNIVFGTIIGAFTGWLFSQFLLGQWIADGLNASGIKASIVELHKIGAAAGFLSGFLKFSFSPSRRK